MTNRSFDITCEPIIENMIKPSDQMNLILFKNDGISGLVFFTHSVWNILITSLLFINVLLLGRAICANEESPEMEEAEKPKLVFFSKFCST